MRIWSIFYPTVKWFTFLSRSFLLDLEIFTYEQVLFWWWVVWSVEYLIRNSVIKRKGNHNIYDCRYTPYRFFFGRKRKKNIQLCILPLFQSNGTLHTFALAKMWIKISINFVFCWTNDNLLFIIRIIQNVSFATFRLFAPPPPQKKTVLFSFCPHIDVPIKFAFRP